MTDLTFDQICLIQDHREQRPLEFPGMSVERGTLTTGDYSVKGLEHIISIERKSLIDLLGVVGRDRERFEREIQRLLGYPTRVIVVDDATWGSLEMAQWNSKVTSQQVIAVAGWIARGIPFVLAGDRTRAARIVARICFLAARRRHRECQAFMPAT